MSLPAHNQQAETVLPAPRWYHGARKPVPASDRRLMAHEGVWGAIIDEVGRRFFFLHEDTATIAMALDIAEATAYRALIRYRQLREEAERQS